MRDEKIVELSEEELESLCACGCSWSYVKI